MLPFLIAISLGPVQAGPPVNLIGSLGDWKPIESTGVRLDLSSVDSDHGKALRLGYDYQNRGGFVLAQRALPIRAGEDFEFSFLVRAESPRNNFEFKVIDPSGENVWWMNRIAYVWPTDWTRIVIRRRHLAFAWGPKPGPIDSIGAVQFGVAANAGGKGTVWIADFSYRAVPKAAPFLPSYRESEPEPGVRQLDLGAVREIGGLITRWAGVPGEIAVDSSVDGIDWSTRKSLAAPAATAWHVMPETQARYLRLRPRARSKFLGAELLRVEDTDTPNHVLATIGRRSNRGVWPRMLLGEQSFWTVVGSRSGSQEILINQDGQVELGQGMPSIEPMMTVGGKTRNWATEKPQASLRDGHLPLPTVTWLGSVGLEIDPRVLAQPNGDAAVVRYRVTNSGARTQKVRLKLRVNPFQVNAPWQFLNREGGFADVRQFSAIRNLVRVNDTTIELSDSISASGLEPMVPGYPGLVVGWFAFDLDLAPKASHDLVLSWRLDSTSKPVPMPEAFAAIDEAETARWREALDQVVLEFPGEGQRWVDVAKSNLGYILVNRDGPAIQPGSRSYERTWIRDGSMSSAALLRFGRFDEVRELIEWYSPHIGEDGWVPCVVDRRGADPVPEHDSHGQYIYLLSEYFRFTGDLATIKKYYPVVQRVVANINRLRLSTRNQSGVDGHWSGMMPESISHEGYSAKPMHSYWDNFWTDKGLRDAEFLARALGADADARAFRASAREFRADLLVSLAGSSRAKGVSYLPGCAELGDFDATSSAIAISPCDLEEVLDSAQVDATFDRYWKFFDDRRSGRLNWIDYTPYEIRSVNAFIMRGEVDRAHAMMRWFLRDTYPSGWNHWAEIVHRHPTQGKWIGDMPHTWVGSEWVKAVRNLVVYEGAKDGSLIIGAGIPESWVRAKAGVTARNMPIPGGRFSLRCTAEKGALVYEIGVVGTTTSTGTLILPRPQTAAWVTINGQPAVRKAGAVELQQFPARVEVRYGPQPSSLGMR